MASSSMGKNYYAPPPPYDSIDHDSTAENPDSNWSKWCKALTALRFTEAEVREYAALFKTNEVTINMIPELTDDILKSIGIEKAGHRIRIQRLKKKFPSTPDSAQRQHTPTPVMTLRCYRHPNVSANDKCHKCKRFLCLQCRRDKVCDGHTRHYCEGCYDECTIL